MRTKSPDVFVIAFTLILLAAAATWVLPGGSYQRQKETVSGTVREVVVPGSYKVEASRPQLGQIFLAPMRGFLRMGAIIGLIFMVGGAFNILNDTGAIAAGINVLVKVLGNGELSVALRVSVHAVSESARRKIEAAGGTVTLLG